MDATLAPLPSSQPLAAVAAADAPLAPISAAERMSSVDIVRGVAVLGILLMNIIGFAFHFAVYADPTIDGGATGINFWTYVVNAVLVDGKMRGIFSLVFGAGVIILSSRAVERGAAADAADIHYRRMIWLLIFGTVHAYLLWYGEILYPYAMLGLLLYPMRKLSPRALTIMGVVFAMLLTLATVGEAFRIRDLRASATGADAASQRGETLTHEQHKAQNDWREHVNRFKPDAAEVARSGTAFRGSFLDVFGERAGLVAFFHFVPYYFPLFWDMLAMMLFGMAMVKTRALSAEKSYAFYGKMAMWSYAVGIPLTILQVSRNVDATFDTVAVAFNGILYEPARIAMCFGHVAVIMMIVKAGAMQWLTSRLAAVGQMAFSNYILQSLICSTIFYGYGFGLHGQLERHQVYYVVLGCWTIHLLWSPWWLQRYRFGPLEWCWRSLTYWKRQPMRLTASV